MSDQQSFDRRATLDELDRARRTFHTLLDSAEPAELRQRSEGTQWTNEQLLFHMLFGYLIVVVLLRMVRLVSRLPMPASRAFAAALDAATVPFHKVNYWGSCAGAVIVNRHRMGPKADRVIAALQRRLRDTDDRELARGMYYPTRWDPFFSPYMTIGELYRYPTRHFEFHRRQLTLTASH